MSLHVLQLEHKMRGSLMNLPASAIKWVALPCPACVCVCKCVQVWVWVWVWLPGS